MTEQPTTDSSGRVARRFVRGAVAFIGLTMTGVGLWAWVDPASFAGFVDFPFTSISCTTWVCSRSD